MTLKNFLKEVGGYVNNIISYDGDKALEAVKQIGYVLKYVHNQTDEICLEAVKQNGDALRYVHNQTDEICLEAVKQNGDALQYVDTSIFEEDKKELTINEIENILGYSIKIVNKEKR